VIEYVDSEQEIDEIVSAAIRTGAFTQAQSLIDLLSRDGRARRRRFPSLLKEEYRVDLADQCRVALVRAMARRGDITWATALARTVENPYSRRRAWADVIEAAPRRKARALLREALSFADMLDAPTARERAEAGSVACVAAAGDFRHAALLRHTSVGRLPRRRAARPGRARRPLRTARRRLPRRPDRRRV
jgi:hypothetical protein